MSRFAILNTTPHPPPAARTPRAGEAEPCGCVWLFRVEPRVDDVREAARDAVLAFFTTEAGRRVREGEQLASLRWEDAVGWVPDEVWARHGLEPLRHPDVERVMLDGEEDLAPEIDATLPRVPRG